MWRKIVAPTALVSAFWLVMGGATICYINWAYHSHAKDLEANFIAVQATDSMQDVLWQLQATAMEVAESADSHTRIEVTELEESFTGYLAAAEANSNTSAAQALVKSIGNQFERYRESIRRRLDSPSPAQSANPPREETARIAHKIASACQELLKVHERLIADSTNSRGQLRRTLDQTMIVLWIAGPTIGIVWGLWIAHRLQRSISQISISLKDAASGLDREVGRVEVLPSDDLPALHQQVQVVSTRIKEAVDQLEQARREAMLADRLAAVGEMAAGVAHELRNPLTAVKLLIQNAVDALPDNPLGEEHLHVVLEQTQRMESTIQGLLDFARPPQVQMVCHDVRDTLNRALNLVEGHAKQQGVVIREDYPSTPVLVDGDPEQLHQVFVNLLLNGVEAMPQGGTLQVTIGCDTAAAANCRVQFRDGGPGIPPAIMARLFEPFVSDKKRGTGLGLAISRRIVQQHGGQLSAANGEGTGAVFTVELPLYRECRDRPAPTQEDPSDDDLATRPNRTKESAGAQPCPSY